MFLTHAELEILTGRHRSDSQRRWLERNGWVFAVNQNGHPVVLRAYAEKRLGGSPASAPGAAVLPNFDALRKAS